MQQIPSWINSIAICLQENGFATYLVGGALRNMILGKTIEDYDLATNAEPSDVVKIFKRTIPTGIRFGTITVLWDRYKVEITTLRGEKNYSDNRHPSIIKFNNDIVKDLSRRDFTINAMAYDLSDHHFYDPFGGLQDIKKEVIRTVGATRKRIKEDALRMLRGVRFASQYNLQVSHSVIIVCRSLHSRLRKLSKERVGVEFHKIIMGDYLSVGMHYLFTSYLMHFMNIDTEILRGIYQSLTCKKNYPQIADTYCQLQITDPAERYAVFMIAIAHYANNSEMDITVKMVNTICSSLIDCGLKKKLINTANAIVYSWLRLFHDSERTIHSYSKIIRSIGRKRINSFYNVVLTLPIEWLSKINISLYAWCCKNISIYSVEDLKITGKDLIQIGIKKGVAIGHALSRLLCMTISNPTINNCYDLLTVSKHMSHNENIDTNHISCSYFP